MTAGSPTWEAGIGITGIVWRVPLYVGVTMRQWREVTYYNIHSVWAYADKFNNRIYGIIGVAPHLTKNIVLQIGGSIGAKPGIDVGLALGGY